MKAEVCTFLLQETHEPLRDAWRAIDGKADGSLAGSRGEQYGAVWTPSFYAGLAGLLGAGRKALKTAEGLRTFPEEAAVVGGSA